MRWIASLPLLCSLLISGAACAQPAQALAAQSPAAQPPAAAGSNWQRLQQLPPHTLIHVSSDRMSRLCVLDSVSDDALLCSAKRVVAASHYTFLRAEIKTVKLTRYLGSTAGGVGIGAGLGLIVGVAGAHNSDSFQLVSNKAIWGITAAIGGVAGGLIGGPTDFLRGPTVYRRP